MMEIGFECYKLISNCYLRQSQFWGSLTLKLGLSSEVSGKSLISPFVVISSEFSSQFLVLRAIISFG